MNGVDVDENDVKSAYHRRPDLEALVLVLLKGGDSLKDSFSMSPGIPLKPMLATPSKGVSTAYKKVEDRKFSCEFKYDGERVQIHNTGGRRSVFSRNLEETTGKYVDIQIESKGGKDYILDGEVVAYDRESKKILSFQTLSTRKRKDIDIQSIKVQVCVFVFDLLFFDGESLVDKSLEERRGVLYREFEEVEGVFFFSTHVDCSNVEEIEDFFRKACEGDYEGIMIKLLDSPYLPSQRSNSWIKLKKDYLDTVGDSFDLVVIGAYYGKGKRAGAYGGFLLASYNDTEEVYESICKIGTGFTEEDLGVLYEEINNYLVDTPRDIKVKDQTKPDVWIKPHLVWEVKSAGISLSPAYCSGIERGEKGVSLRFPRFIRSRGDKKPEDATTSDHIYFIYKEIKDLE